MLVQVQAKEKVYKVFINEQGKFYKAESAKSPADAENNLPTPDMINVLNDTPCSREEMIAKIIALGNERITTTLAPSSIPPQGDTKNA